MGPEDNKRRAGDCENCQGQPPAAFQCRLCGRSGPMPEARQHPTQTTWDCGRSGHGHLTLEEAHLCQEVGDLRNLEDLLDPAAKKKLSEDLAEIHRRRRQAEAEFRGLPMA